MQVLTQVDPGVEPVSQGNAGPERSAYVNSRLVLLVAVIGNWAPISQVVRGNGLDPSWRQALTYFIGRQYSFTYGPLGWLIAGAAQNRVQLIAIMVSNFALLLFVACETNSLFHFFGLKREAIWFTGLLLGCFSLVGLAPEWLPFLLAVASVRTAVQSPSAKRLMLNWLLATLCLLAKSSLGLLGIALAVLLSVFLVRRRAPFARWVSLAGSLVCLAGVWALSLTGDLRIIGGIAASFGAEMSIPYEQGVVGSLFFVPFILFAAIRIWRQAVGIVGRVEVPLLLGGTFVFLYLQGTTRADYGHFVIFAGLAPFLVALYQVVSRPAGSTIQVRRILPVVLSAVCLAGLFAEDGFLSAVTAVHPSKFTATRSVIDRTMLDNRDTLNPEFKMMLTDVETIVGDQTISPYPWEYGDLIGALPGLTPLPTLQNYVAFTPEIDHYVAETLTVEGPDFILFREQQIDKRHPNADSPRTRRALTCAYESVGAFPAGHRLLKRKSTDELSCSFSDALSAASECASGDTWAVVLTTEKLSLTRRGLAMVGFKTPLLFGRPPMNGRLTAASFGYPVVVNSDVSREEIAQALPEEVAVSQFGCWRD
jgi:hypothetical protein